MNDLKKQLDLLKQYTFTLEVQNKARQNQRIGLIRELQYCHEQLKKASSDCISCEQQRHQLQVLHQRLSENKVETKTTGEQSLVQSFGRDILEKSLTDLRQQNMMLQQAVQQQQQIINKLTLQLESRDRSSSKYNQNNFGSYSLMKNEAQGYKIELESTKRQLNAITAKYEDLLRKMNLMGPSQKKINVQILKMESKMKELEANKTTIEEEVLNLKSELFSKENQIIKLKRELYRTNPDQKSSRIKSSRNSAQQDYERLYEQNKNLKYQLSCQQQTTIEQNQDISKYVEQLSHLRRQINNRDIEIKSQAGELQRLHSYIGNYEQKIHEIEQQVEHNIQLQKGPTTERQQFQTINLKQQIHYLQTENQRLRQINISLQKKLQIQQLNNNQLTKKWQDYQSRLPRNQQLQLSFNPQNYEYQGVPTTKLTEDGQLKNLMLQLKQELIDSKLHTQRQQRQANNFSQKDGHIFRYLSQPKLSILQPHQNFTQIPSYITSYGTSYGASQPNYASKIDRRINSGGSYPANKCDQNRQSWVKMQKKIQQLRKQNYDLKSVLISRKRLHTRC